MVIVESNKEKEIFLNYWNEESSIVIPIWEDLQKHPMNNGVSFLYIRFSTNDFIIPINHNDCEQIEIDLSTSETPKLVWDKKGLLQANLDIQSLYDLQSHNFFTTNNLLPLGDKLEPLTNFYTRLGLVDDLGKSIPIMKWVEFLQSFTNDIEQLPLGSEQSWVDETMIPILSQIEQHGILVDREKFIDRWPSNGKQLKPTKIGPMVFTEYNPYTITSRPSNRHGGINFGALNKKDGSRNCFIPHEGKMFLQFDYDAYHVRIISKLINFPLPDGSVHQWLADQYGCSYEDSKGRTFRILYGGVSDEDRKIPFFDKVDEFIQTLYQVSLKRGYLETPKKRRISLEWIEQPNSQKFFNYLLQATETEFNIEVMKKLKQLQLPLPILYSYDAFLFQFDDSEIETIKLVKSVLESYGFPVKADWGKNYGEI